jgi:GT2 family glycosyltransferase
MGPSTPAPRASIVIVTYGQRALTEQCLRSLQMCLGERLGREWELVLVDNNSPDDSPELLRSWADRATVRLLDHNRNFAGGCNLGASLSRGEVLIFLNNDTEVTPGALETLVEQALEPGVSVAGCRLLFPNGTLQHAGVAFIHGQALGGAAMPQHVFHHQDGELALARASYEMDCVTAACMAVRAETFRAVGGFDEEYLNGLEDVDLCLRIRLTGERIVYRGDATVVHYEGASRGKGQQLWATPEKIAAMRHNDERFVGRWATQLGQDDELAAALWDAALQDQPPPRHALTADVMIAGQPTGIGPAADEARALLVAFAARGEVVGVADSPVPTVIPRLSHPMATLVDQARRRLPVPGAAWMMVPSGARDLYAVGHPANIVRLASALTAVPLEASTAVWASCPSVADALIQAGVPAGQVAVVPSPIIHAARGSGGEGVLSVLPVHDPGQARLVLEALRGLPISTPTRLLPTVFTRHLDRQIAEILPHAELLRPCSDEARFAALAASADVVLALNSADRFERRALIAAGVGAAPITCSADGPTAAVLGAGVATDPEMLADKLTELLAEPGDRLERANRVAHACAPETVIAHVHGSPARRQAA